MTQNELSAGNRAGANSYPDMHQRSRGLRDYEMPHNRHHEQIMEENGESGGERSPEQMNMSKEQAAEDDEPIMWPSASQVGNNRKQELG